MTATSRNEMGNQAFASTQSKSRTMVNQVRVQPLQVISPDRLATQTQLTHTMDCIVNTEISHYRRVA